MLKKSFKITTGMVFIQNIKMFLKFLIFDIKTVRKVIGLTPIKFRTKSNKRKSFRKDDKLVNFVLGNFYQYKNERFKLSEFLNTVWFVFFPIEWYDTFNYNNKVLFKKHYKNIHFSFIKTNNRRVISINRFLKKKKTKNDRLGFNIGYYYYSTVVNFSFFNKFKN